MWGLSNDHCFDESEQATLFWNNPFVFFYINNEFLIKDIIFNGYGIFKSKRTEINTCTSSEIPCCEVECPLGLEPENDILEYKNKYKEPPLGIFQYEYWPDVKWLSSPNLNIEVKN